MGMSLFSGLPLEIGRAMWGSCLYRIYSVIKEKTSISSAITPMLQGLLSVIPVVKVFRDKVG